MTRSCCRTSAVARWGAASLLCLSSLSLSPLATADETAPVAPPAPAGPQQQSGRVAPEAPAPPPAVERPRRRVLPSPMPTQLPFAGMTRRPVGPAPTISATDRLVYVLMGNTLYALDAKTLKEVAQTTLEPLPPVAQPRGFGLRERPQLPDAPRAPEALPRRPGRDGNALPPLPPPAVELPPPASPVPGPRPDGLRAPRAVPPDGPQPPGEPFRGFRPFRPNAPAPVTPGFAPFAPMAPTISATDHYVYVLRGNRLYAFDAKTLKEVAKTTLEAPGGSNRPSGR